MKSIYAITPSGMEIKKLIKEIEKMLDHGIRLFQYREKYLNEEKSIIDEKSDQILSESPFKK